MSLPRTHTHTHLNPIPEKRHPKNAGPAEIRSKLAGCGRTLWTPQAENQLAANLSKNLTHTRTLSGLAVRSGGGSGCARGREDEAGHEESDELPLLPQHSKYDSCSRVLLRAFYLTLFPPLPLQ